MSAVHDHSQLERLRLAVVRGMGLNFEDARMDVLAAAAGERLAAQRISFDELVSRIEAAHPEEVRALAERLTVGETYFFRNTNDLQAFVRVVLPARIRARAGQRRLRILSAGCSSGEEPYTIAMLVQQVPELATWDVRITGIDLNPAAIARATAARYSAWSLRQTPEDTRDRFFRKAGREYWLLEQVRARVSFEQRNLVMDDPAFWGPGAFDVVFCRNVMMYFAPEVTRRVVARIAASLTPGGFLFLGHAETLRGVSTEFHLRHSHGTFYYQRRDGELDPVLLTPGPAASLTADEPAPATTDADWMEAIRQASDRIAELTTAQAARAQGGGAAARAEPSGPATPPAPLVAPVQPVAQARELLKQERFAAALAALGAAPLEDETDTDVLLLRAVLLVSSGNAAAAEEVCERILALDELNADAHYVKALCREHAGDLAGAANQDHYALYLDATFAMPRLHLGLLARRAGDLDGARRELSRAVALLAAEDAPRILLLGGGFGREALSDLARAELRACGGAP
ncbi:MAG TPA: protein-glutamate O-methyltransferase CheR [Anaeromyxobacteraceae bacterium]|nr:protein-glutamate O-methyltransferase CheR [Anaeromyxobacteraceae bacterium]